MLFDVVLRRGGFHCFPAGAAVTRQIRPEFLLAFDRDQDVDVDAAHDHHGDEEEGGEGNAKMDSEREN